MRTITTSNDYLAIIPIGVGCTWGRSSNKETAIKYAVSNLKDWTVYYKLSGVEVTVNVIDVSGYDKCVWGETLPGYIHGTNEETGIEEAITRPFEHVKRMTPKWKRRK